MMATKPAPESHSYQIGPLCMSISIADFREWLAVARPGGEIVYATGPVLDQKRDVVLLAGQYIEAGLIRPHSRQVEGRWEYFAVRCHASAPPPTDRVEDITAVKGNVMSILCRAATLGR